MITKLFSLLSIICIGKLYHAQNNFPYEREWGTYVGGTGTYLSEFSVTGTSLFKDSQNNFYVPGTTSFANGYNASYYNQFVAGGGNTIFPGTSNYYNAQFSSGGQLLKGSYYSNANFERILGIDALDNVYTMKRMPGQIQNLATSGAWLTQGTNAAGTFTIILSKRDANNNLLWTTYLPNNGGSQYFTLRFDDQQNVYLLGNTHEDIPGLGTAGVFQQNFVPYSVSNIQHDNSYLVKLSPSGQKIWGTFSVTGIFDFKFYNNELYLVSQYFPAMPGNFTDPGTFQPIVPASNIIMKWNANTGQKVWGTFYGTPLNPQLYTGSGISVIQVNSTGIYVSGQNEDDDYPTYFATPGAFKGQMTGGDLFLSKFDLTGNRVWSTYFGGIGYDIINGSDNLTVLDNRIIITGSQNGSASNISTPGAFLTTVPNPSGSSNMYFAEFDHLGNRKWASYYGGLGGNFFGEHLNAKFLNNGSFVLWGLTGSPTGIGTEGAAHQNMTNPYPGNPFGFIARFNLKNELLTSDLVKDNGLQLYDNPNNGSFTISGGILEKQKTSLSIFDMSGKLIYQTACEKKKINQFDLNNKLIKGNYLLEVVSEKGEKLKIFKMTVK
ncbi:T9SS type A sorting domain-containing protein [Chryseobacterium sp. 09-1422]|uniref:T9SS type A sorting domain-containing protein n=1 Tax=Chryseobacterium kimseyorum TaxID=2984028 RepID=A0ABT3HTR7_9FLAO|nr:T9SS type A sorting domain-containing protein [Chryseobacterium kimseyorum]MCW3167181.1 T9SS type A sorting domain-containing protein [Chryseobacterium kimseyorum]